jgi:delta24-sterol reductase
MDEELVGGPANLPRSKEIEALIRPYIVFLIVLPLSFVVTLWRRCKRYFTKPLPSGHAERVMRVQADLKLASAESVKVVTDRSPASSHSVRLIDKRKYTKVRMEDLRCILSSDKTTVTVEPGVTVGEVTDYLLAKGRILDCTLEMEEATLGGLAMATGMTTHSHVCGLIHDTIVQYDIVTADGKIVNANAADHSELFCALPWSHGTLGLLVALTLRTVQAKPYVRLSYHHVSVKNDRAATMASFVAAYETEIHKPDPAFFLEGIIFGKDEVCVSNNEWKCFTHFFFLRRC